jgi:hypothetical protein
MRIFNDEACRALATMVYVRENPESEVSLILPGSRGGLGFARVTSLVR